MRKTKLLACLLAGALAVSLTACGGNTSSSSSSSSADKSTTEAKPAETTGTSEDPTKPAENGSNLASVEGSIDFEDGNCGFVAAYLGAADSSEVEIAVADFKGSKALQITNKGTDTPYIGIDVQSLLGDKITDVAKIQMDVGLSYADGKFRAVQGRITTWTGQKLDETSYDWTVYLETKNPARVSADISAVPFTADNDNIIIVGLNAAKSADAGAFGDLTIYIDNLVFLDASGNAIAADTSATFAGPDKFGSGDDFSNLCAVSGAVNFEGFATSSGAWNQDGFDMTDDIIAALVPGSVVEIQYSSENGDMWVVMPGAAVGWKRIGVGNIDGSGSAADYTNNSKNICQIPYELFAEVLGDDVSTWGATMQCEASGAWEVYSVRVGQAVPRYGMSGAGVDFEGFATSAGAWNQDGFDMTEDIIAALVPGSIVEISYGSENGDMWLVFPDSAAGWKRVGVGNVDGSGTAQAVWNGSKSYVTYEMIAEILGDDVSTWGARMQCEASGAWEVFGIKVGTATQFKMVNNEVAFEGFATSAGAWNQDGFDFTEDILAALVPGSVINIKYSSENGDMWLVFPDSAAGWKRIGVGNIDNSGSTPAAYDGSVCQVTYEMIAEVLGDDVSTWGARLQCEASGAWEVFGITVGQGR